MKFKLQLQGEEDRNARRAGDVRWEDYIIAGGVENDDDAWQCCMTIAGLLRNQVKSATQNYFTLRRKTCNGEGQIILTRAREGARAIWCLFDKKAGSDILEE